jgi:hypothetical protein
MIETMGIKRKSEPKRREVQYGGGNCIVQVS